MSAYLIRAATEELTDDLSGAEDRLFVNQRFDGGQLRDGLYLQCTFANVSFLQSRLEHVAFSACVFESCYFRATTIQSCTFSATRFINCDFVKPTIVGCDFRYARFKGCFPPYEEISASLPGEHNIRGALAENLCREATAAGNGPEARNYLLTAIKANEQHLGAAFKASTKYYRDHFPTALDRGRALLALLRSRINGFLWGYGQRGLALLRSVLLATLVMYPLLFWLARTSIHDSSGHEASVGDCVWLSASSIIGDSGLTGLTAIGFARALVIAEGATGLLLFGLFVTYLYRYVTRR